MRKLGLFLAAALFFFSPAVVRAELERNSSERELFELLNRDRAAQNLAPLQWDEHLFKAARQHALLMLNMNQLEHQLPNEPGLEARLAEAGARFTAIAENIAIGQNPETVHDGWMHSPGHRKNILDPRLTSVGIAAVHGPGGIYAVQDFSQLVPELSIEQQEQKVIAWLTAQGFRSTEGTESARKSCANDSGLSGTSARALVRFEVTDLNKFPEEIERKLRSQILGKVAVGACSPKPTSGFSRYEIVVLFF